MNLLRTSEFVTYNKPNRSQQNKTALLCSKLNKQIITNKSIDI